MTLNLDEYRACFAKAPPEILDTLEATIYAVTLAALLLVRWRSRVSKSKPIARVTAIEPRNQP